MEELTYKAIMEINKAIMMIGFKNDQTVLHGYYYALGSLDMAKELGAIDDLTAEHLKEAICNMRDEVTNI